MSSGCRAERVGLLTIPHFSLHRFSFIFMTSRFQHDLRNDWFNCSSIFFFFRYFLFIFRHSCFVFSFVRPFIGTIAFLPLVTLEQYRLEGVARGGRERKFLRDAVRHWPKTGLGWNKGKEARKKRTVIRAASLIYLDKEYERMVTAEGKGGVASKWVPVQARGEICNITRGVLINRVGQSKRGV